MGGAMMADTIMGAMMADTMGGAMMADMMTRYSIMAVHMAMVTHHVHIHMSVMSAHMMMIHHIHMPMMVAHTISWNKAGTKSTPPPMCIV